MTSQTFRATLVLPSGVRIHLIPTADDARSRYNIPVLLLPEWSEHPATVHNVGGPLAQAMPADQDIVDGATFRALRRLGCHIETSDPIAVCRSLGVPDGEMDVREIEA